MANPNHKNRSKGSRWLGLIVLIFCGVALSVIASSHPETLSELSRVEGWRLSLTTILLLAYFLTYSLRLQLVVEAWSDQKIPKGHFLKLMVAGRVYNVLLPQSGTAYRGIALKRNYGISYAKYIESQAAFGILDLIINISICVILWSGYTYGALAGAATLATLSALACVCFCFRNRLAVMARQERPGRFQAWMKGVLGSVIELTKPTFAIRFIVLSLFCLFLMAAVFGLYFKHLNVSPTIAEIAVFYTLYRCTFYFAITPGNLGLRELAVGLIGTPLGIGSATAIFTALIVRIQSYAVLLFMGLPLYCFIKAPEFPKYKASHSTQTDE